MNNIFRNLLSAFVIIIMFFQFFASEIGIAGADANVTVIDFGKESLWSSLGNMPQFSKSSEQAFADKTFSAKISGKSNNWNGFIDLASIGFATNWMGYDTLKIRYRTSDINYVPAVYLSSYKGWVTSKGQVLKNNEVLAENQGAYRLKPLLYFSKKPSETGWVTVEFSLSKDFVLYPNNNTNISMSDITYLFIPTHQLGQYWNNDPETMTDISGVDKYIDCIWLEKKTTSFATLDFGGDDAWKGVKGGSGTKNLTESATTVADGKTKSARLLKNNVYNNTGGWIDLAKAGFTTDWSGFSTIEIKYYTNTPGVLPAIYPASKEDWVLSSDTENSSYKLKKSAAERAEYIDAGWNTVAYSLGENGDFIPNKGASWSNITYLQIPSGNLNEYWSKIGIGNIPSGGEGASTYDASVEIYLDSISLICDNQSPLAVYDEKFTDETGFILNGSETTAGKRNVCFEAGIFNYGKTNLDIMAVLSVTSGAKSLKTVSISKITIPANSSTTVASPDLMTDKITLEDGDVIKAMIWSDSEKLIPLCSKNMSLRVDISRKDERYIIYPDDESVVFENGVAQAEAEYWCSDDKSNDLIESDLLSCGAGIEFKNSSGGGAIVSNPLSVYTQPLIKVTFEVEKDNTLFTFWARYSAATSGSDSLYWGIDNGGYATYSLDMTNKGEYKWAVIGIRALDLGTHTFNVTAREFNLCIDKFVISSNPLYMADGMGEYIEGDISLTEIVYATDMVPKSERPRVMINKSDISVIMENAKKTENISSYNSYLKYSSAAYDIRNLNNNGTYPPDIVSVIESKAFSYVAESDESNGIEAINTLKNLIAKCSDAVLYDYNSIGETTYLIGIVYDWCYPLLSAEDKLFLQNQVIILNNKSEIGWPPSKGSAVITHSSEGMLLRDLMVCAIAMYEDRPDIYQNVMGRFFGEYVTARKDFYQKAGSYLMGNHYLQYRYQWELFADRLIEKAYGIKHIFGEDYGKLMYKLIYSRRPDGGILQDGDSSFNEAPGQYIRLNARDFFYGASLFDDPYLKYYAKKQKPTDSLGSYTFGYSSQINQQITPVEFMIMNNPDVQPESYEEFPLTRYFPSPYGSMIARTGWNEGIDSGDVVAEMKICEYSLGEHQHLDSGAFQLYYKGALATDTGYYQQINSQRSAMNEFGNTACSSLHDRNYQSRTVAHNCMLVYDPDETHVSKEALNVVVENDGGQVRKNKSVAPITYEEIIGNDDIWRSGKVLAYGFDEKSSEPGWSYLKGDIKAAYSGKVKEYERSFMFLNLKNSEVPAALKVFDRIKSSDVSFKKTWLLHTMNTPVISENRATARVTHSGYNGKLVLDMLLPEPDNTSVCLVDGAEGDAWVNGTNYYADLKPGLRNEGGGSRLEVSPVKASELDYFLNVLQVSDADKNYYESVSKLETSSHAGALVADRVVLFAKQHGRISDDIEFSFDGEENKYKITVCDCKAGEWEIYSAGKLLCRAYASEDAGVLEFEAVPGAYTLKYT